MAQVAKIIELVGSSPNSLEEAAAAAVREASKTIRHITGVEITNMTADVEGDRITMWRATVKIAFGIESERPAT